MLVESNFVLGFMRDKLSLPYAGSKRILSPDYSDDSSLSKRSTDSLSPSLEDDSSLSKSSTDSLSPSAACLDDDDLSADIADALLPKRRRQYRDRRVKLAVRVVKSDIRRSYPQIIINLCNINDAALFYQFLTTYAVPNLYSLQDFGEQEAAFIGHTIEDMVSTLNTNMSMHPDRVTSIRSSQLRRRSDTDKSLLEVHSIMKYTNIKTMQKVERYMSVLIMMNKEKRIVAMYCSGKFSDPVSADESALTHIHSIWNIC